MLEVQLAAEEVHVEEKMVQLAELVVVVVAWTIKQGCEELDGSDDEQPLEAMQLPVLPM